MQLRMHLARFSEPSLRNAAAYDIKRNKVSDKMRVKHQI